MCELGLSVGTVNVNGICVKRSSHLAQQCEAHQILVDGQCFDTAVIGGICQIDAQCSGGADCLNRRCACPLGTVQNKQMFLIVFTNYNNIRNCIG